MRLFQAALDTCLDSPFFASLSVHGLHFTVYAPSSFFSVTGANDVSYDHHRLDFDTAKKVVRREGMCVICVARVSGEK